MRLIKETAPIGGAFLLALGIGALITVLTGYSVPAVFRELAEGAFGGLYQIARTLRYATPILFTSLSFLIAFRCGLFNIGAEGQLYLGAFAAAWAGFTLKLPPVIHPAVCLLFGAVAGGIWGFVPGWLRARRGANEFVTTMMLSYVAIYFTSWLVRPGGPYHGSAWANQTARIARTAELPRLLPGAQLSWGIIVGVLVAVLVWYLLFHTPRGYELRAVGQNPLAAEYGGIKAEQNMVLVMTLAGALAGLGGGAEILGTLHRFIDGFSPGYGWDGIAGGLIARSHPIGAIFAAILMGALRAGGAEIDQTGVAPFDLASVIQGLVILFIVAPELFHYFKKIRIKKRNYAHNQS